MTGTRYITPLDGLGSDAVRLTDAEIEAKVGAETLRDWKAEYRELNEGLLGRVVLWQPFVQDKLAGDR
jgi:hypothetical protein